MNFLTLKHYRVLLQIFCIMSGLLASSIMPIIQVSISKGDTIVNLENIEITFNYLALEDIESYEFEFKLNKRIIINEESPRIINKGETFEKHVLFSKDNLKDYFITGAATLTYSKDDFIRKEKTFIYFLYNNDTLLIKDQIQISSQKDHYWKVNTLDYLPEKELNENILSASIPDDKTKGILIPNRTYNFKKDYIVIEKNISGLNNEDEPFTNSRTRPIIHVTGTIYFLNSEGDYIEYRNGTVQIWDQDAVFDDYLGSTITDNDGNFTLNVEGGDGWLDDEIEIYLQILTANNKVIVYEPITVDAYRWFSNVVPTSGEEVDYGALSIETGGYGACSIFHWMNMSWSYTATNGFDPGEIVALWPNNEDGSYYSLGGAIYLSSNTWGWNAEDVTYHEYGHALMYEAQGGWWPENTGGTHFFNSILHPNFAWTEGWATAFAQFVDPDGVYNSGWTFQIEDQTGYSTLPEGFNNEARVAAALNDLVDINQDGNDYVEIDYQNIISTLIDNNNNHIIDFWNNLAPGLTEQEYVDGAVSMVYNTIEIDFPDLDPLLVSISGPSNLNLGETGTFTANPTGGTDLYTNYRWWYKRGIPPASSKEPSLGSEWISMSEWDGFQTIDKDGNYPFILKVKVFDSIGNIGITQHSVQINRGSAKTADSELAINHPFLKQNYPNPFNPNTTIEFAIDGDSYVSITVYNITGKIVKRLKNGYIKTGIHLIIWDGKDSKGQLVSSGKYFYSISTMNKQTGHTFTETKSMVFIK